MNKQKGFTLIELVIVIVLLGILSVTVAPKFIDIQSDAKVSVLKAIGGSLNSAATMTYSKAVIQNKEKAASSERVTVNGQRIEIKYGYPEAIGETDGDIRDLIQLDDEIQVCLGRNSSCSDSTSSNIRFGYSFEQASPCFAYYIEPGGTGGKPNEYVVGLETSGC